MDNATCLPLDQCYALFQKWGVDTTPFTNVGVFSKYKDLTQSLKEVYKQISNSTLKEEELGTVLYFVVHEEESEVLSMAKIETKESLALKYLIQSLRTFWKLNEDITKWTQIIDSDYNEAFQTFMFYLESLNINDFKGYMAIGQCAYKLLKDDIELYKKLKFNLPEFLNVIYKQSGYSTYEFKSSVLNYQNEESDQSSEVKDEVKPEVVNGTSTPKRKEDAIDRLMKNDYIRKNSKIEYEDQPLESIIGSQKKEKPIKSNVSLRKSLTKKDKNKGLKKQQKKNKTMRYSTEEETPKTHNYNTVKEQAPKKTRDLDFEDMEDKSKVMDGLIDEETPMPRGEIPTQFEEILEPSISTYQINIKTADSKLISANKLQRHLVLPKETELVNWNIDLSLKDL